MADISVAIISQNTLSVAVGNHAVPKRRITESGDVRRTRAGNTRILSDYWFGVRGRVLVHGPALTLFARRGEDWTLIVPRVRHNGVWKAPRHIHIKDGDVWRTVQTPEPQE